AFFHEERPMRMWGARPGSVRNVTISAAALRALVRHPEDLAGQLVRRGPALQLLDGYLRSLIALEEPPPPELARRIGDHVLDLVAAVLGPSAGAQEIIAKRGLK